MIKILKLDRDKSQPSGKSRSPQSRSPPQVEFSKNLVLAETGYVKKSLDF